VAPKGNGFLNVLEKIERMAQTPLSKGFRIWAWFCWLLKLSNRLISYLADYALEAYLTTPNLAHHRFDTQ
jgi:hypothetical protein